MRYTACLSTQVGCAMNCQFCFTGRMGLLGNLSTAQVIEQVVAARRWLAQQHDVAVQDIHQQQHHQQQQHRQHQQHMQHHQHQHQQQSHIARLTSCNDLSSDDAVTRYSTTSTSGCSRGTADVPTAPLDSSISAVVTPNTASSSSSNINSSTSSRSSSNNSRNSYTSSGGTEAGQPTSSSHPPPSQLLHPRINNIVFMGMGEPLHNMSAVMPALDILASPPGLALSRSKIIVSTVGLVPQLREVRASRKAKLAVSLHATTDEIRDWIVPTNRRYPLAELMGALEELYPIQSAKSDDFVVIEYVMLKGANDSDEDAARLLDLTCNIYCMINLIVFNPHEGTKFEGSDEGRVLTFRGLLNAGGKVCTVRMSKGDDEMAACGQLGDPGLTSRQAPMLKPPKRLREGAAAVQ